MSIGLSSNDDSNLIPLWDACISIILPAEAPAASVSVIFSPAWSVVKCVILVFSTKLDVLAPIKTLTFLGSKPKNGKPGSVEWPEIEAVPAAWADVSVNVNIPYSVAFSNRI